AGPPPRPRRDRGRWRRLPPDGFGGGAGGGSRPGKRGLPASAADLPRRFTLPLRLLLGGGARPLPAADHGQRRRPEGRDRDALRRQYAGPLAGDRSGRREALPGGPRDRQADG